MVKKITLLCIKWGFLPCIIYGLGISLLWPCYQIIPTEQYAPYNNGLSGTVWVTGHPGCLGRPVTGKITQYLLRLQKVNIALYTRTIKTFIVSCVKIKMYRIEVSTECRVFCIEVFQEMN